MASTRELMLSDFHASGARPLTRCASAPSTSQPWQTSSSCTNRAPFVDSIMSGPDELLDNSDDEV